MITMPPISNAMMETPVRIAFSGLIKVVDLKGKKHAEEVGRMEYQAPDRKAFVVMSAKGSGWFRALALNPDRRISQMPAGLSRQGTWGSVRMTGSKSLANDWRPKPMGFPSVWRGKTPWRCPCMKVDVKTVQEILRHQNLKTTLGNS